MKSKCQEIKWSVREVFTNFPFSSLIAPKLQPLSSNSYMDSSLTANRFLTKVGLKMENLLSATLEQRFCAIFFGNTRVLKPS